MTMETTPAPEGGHFNGLIEELQLVPKRSSSLLVETPVALTPNSVPAAVGQRPERGLSEQEQALAWYQQQRRAGAVQPTGGDQDWQAQAACRGANVAAFFPERNQRATQRAAKAICQRCVVKEECLQYALANNETVGVWGGLTTRERQAIRRQQRAANSSH